MVKSKIFFYACLFFIIGVFVRSVFSLDIFIIYLILLAGFFCSFLYKINKYWLIIGFWLIFFVLGILRYEISLPRISDNQITFYNQQKTEFVGIVSKEPDQRQAQVKYEIKTEQVIIDDQPQKATGKVLISNFLYPQYGYGDRLKIVCDLKAPEEFNGFAYDDYLARYNIYSLCYYPQIELLAQGQGNFILAGIYNFKNHFVTKINQILPEPHASFLAGILIGAKKSLPADLAEVFNQTGTTHIIAVSGYNVTIIATFLMLFLQNLGIGRKKAFWQILIGLIVFAIITGLQASIIRASIMGGLVLLAQYLGRMNKIGNALLLTAVIMLIVNPKILVFDLGFQLSFLATLGLVYFNPVLVEILKVEKFIKLKSLKIIIVDYFLTTMSAIILTTPLILYNFGKISLVAPLANILILPFIPIAMLLGFIAVVLALIYQPIGWVVGWLVWFVLQYIIWILNKLADFNWAYYEFDKIGLGLMVGAYLVISLIIVFHSKIRPKML